MIHDSSFRNISEYQFLKCECKIIGIRMWYEYDKQTLFSIYYFRVWKLFINVSFIAVNNSWEKINHLKHRSQKKASTGQQMKCPQRFEKEHVLSF